MPELFGRLAWMNNSFPATSNSSQNVNIKCKKLVKSSSFLPKNCHTSNDCSFLNRRLNGQKFKRKSTNKRGLLLDRKCRLINSTLQQQSIDLQLDLDHQHLINFNSPHLNLSSTKQPSTNRRLFSNFLIFVTLLLSFPLLTEAHQGMAMSGNRRVGEILPYDPMDARAQAEAELEEDLRREFVRNSMVQREDMTYRFPPKKTYSEFLQELNF